MLDVYPQLAPLKTELAWSGQMAYARHLMPQVGQLQPDVWHITAFGGHGLNTTAIAGKVLAEAMLGQSDRIQMFAPFGAELGRRADWAGGGATDLLGLAGAGLVARAAGARLNSGPDPFPTADRPEPPASRIEDNPAWIFLPK